MFKKREKKQKRYNFRQMGTRRLFIFALVASIFPSVWITISAFTKFIEWYIVILFYTVVLLFLAFIVNEYFNKEVSEKVNEIFKNEEIISRELIKINTEEKLKNVLSLEFERSQQSQMLSTVVFFDVDDLGEVNKTFDIFTGDKVLIDIVKVTKAFIQENSILASNGCQVARVKGDTFAIVMPNVSHTVAYDITNQLRDRIHNIKYAKVKDQDKEREINVTCRYVVLSIDQWQSEDKFVHLAYEKLKLAKDYGKGTIL